MGTNKRSPEVIQAAKDSIVEYLDIHGSTGRKQIRKELNPNCGDSTVDDTLKRWRIVTGIPVKGKVLSTAGIKTSKRVQDDEPVKVDNVTDDRSGVQVAFVPVDNKPAPQVKSKPIEPVKPSPVVDIPLHNFSCAGKVPVDVYQKFKVIAAYRNESARSLIGEWMSDYVRKHKGVFKEISALADE